MGKDKKALSNWKLLGAIVTLQTTLVTGIFEYYDKRAEKNEKHIREHTKLEMQSAIVQKIQTDLESIKTKLSTLILRNRFKRNEANNHTNPTGDTR